jgi:hypothetical protein
VSVSPPVHLHIRPRLRPIGEALFPAWLAVTLGDHIWAWRPLTAPELAHEVAHVRQWRRHGAGFPLLYLRASVRAWRAGRHWYWDNTFEREARAARR